METASANRKIRSRPRQAARCAAGKAKSATLCPAASATDGFLKHSFLPMYQPAQDLPERSATERDFFKSRSYLQKHYGLTLSDFSGLPYPYNLMMAQRELDKKLRVLDKYRHLQIVEQENGQVCLTVRETADEEFSLIYIPVMPIYNLWQQEQYRPCAELLTAVCAYLYAEAGISYYRDEGAYMYDNYETLKDWIEDDWGDAAEDYEQEKIALKNAEIQGDFMQAKIMDRGFRANFANLIGCFQAISEFETDCLSIAQRCLRIAKMFPDGNLFRHANLQDYEVDDYEDNYVGMHEYISFIGSVTDALSDRMRMMVNDDFNERAHYQEPEIVTFFNEPQPIYTDQLAYEREVFGLIDDLCTLLYRKP